MRRYVHLSTGNYATGTAKLYQDLGILTCNAELGEGVSAVLTNSPQRFRQKNTALCWWLPTTFASDSPN